jgi:hypothetical protein
VTQIIVGRLERRRRQLTAARAYVGMGGEEAALRGLRELAAVARAAHHQQLAARLSLDRLEVGRRQREAVAPERRAGRPRVPDLHEQRVRVVRMQHAGEHAVQPRRVRGVVGAHVFVLEQRAAAFDVARIVAFHAGAVAVERHEANAADLQPLYAGADLAEPGRNE